MPLRVSAGTIRGGLAMSAMNRLRNKVQRASGRAKETVGRATGDRKLQGRGVGDQFKADVKDVGEQVKETFGGRRRRGGRRI
jgi:uncharacterized protein YjbJ (UPF0337 family)